MPCIILVKKPLVFFLSNVGDAQEIIETHTRLHDGHAYISHVVHIGEKEHKHEELFQHTHLCTQWTRTLRFCIPYLAQQLRLDGIK